MRVPSIGPDLVHCRLVDRRRTIALLTGVAAAFSMLSFGVTGSVTAGAASPAPVAAPKTFPAGIEPENISYVAQASCDPAFKPGTATLAGLLSSTYPGISVGGSYGCGTDGSISEHYEGRAIDWMTSALNPVQAADANAFVGWLLATDKAGNKYAMARRLGVMYIIWNNRIWGGWDGTWQDYNGCSTKPEPASDNACHRTHVHLSLTWNGATGRTSYWSGEVTATDYGPCRATDLNWAPRYSGYNPTPCPRYAKVSAPAGASAILVRLYTYSGATLSWGATGPDVSAVQAALGIIQTGNYLELTRSTVAAWQSAHHLSATGIVEATTWRALLASLAPPSTPTKPAVGSCPSTLTAPQVLLAGSWLCSPDRRTVLIMQTDGNLVLYRDGRPVWMSHTAGKGPKSKLVLQSDGNLVLYGANNRPAWHTHTSRQGAGAQLIVQNDGNVVLYNGRARFATGTVRGR